MTQRQQFLTPPHFLILEEMSGTAITHIQEGKKAIKARG